MKYIKRILLSIFILLVLAAAFVFVLITFYKKEMAGMLTDHLKKSYGLTLSVEDADVSFMSNWPLASVQLKNIYLASDLYPNKNEPFLRAASISLSFNLERLLKKEFIVKSISIKNAEVMLVKDEEGRRNFELKKDTALTDKDSSAGKAALQFEVDKVSLKNVHFRFLNRAKKQSIDLRLVENTIRLKHAQDGLRARLSGDINIAGLLFNPSRGAFLQNAKVKAALDVSVYFKSKMIIVHPSSSLEIQKHPYRVNAFVNLKDTSWMMLHLESEQVDYVQAGYLLTPKIQRVLNNFAVEKPFDVKATIITKLNIKEDPILIVDMDIKDNAVQIGTSKVPYSNLFLHARLLSLDSSQQKGNIEQAHIHFTHIKGKIYDYPFTASVQLQNLVTPDIRINARMFIEAQKIKYRVAQDFILKGNCVALLNYTGPTNKLNKDNYLGPAMHLSASLQFNNFSYQEKNKPYVYTVNGRANVNNRDLKFENLLLRTDGGDAVLKGKAEGFVNYVLGNSNSLKATLSATSNYLNLNPYLLKKPGQTTAMNEDKAANAKQNVQQQTDDSHFEFNATLFAKKLIIRKVEAGNASIDLLYKEKLLNIKSIKANTCGGKIAARATVYDLSKITAEMEMQDIDISELFVEFENFGQKKVESKNLKGRIFLTSTFKTDLDENMEVKGPTMAGEVKLKLKDGHLQNFEPVQSLSNFIFKNRDFNDVAFTELDATFRVKGYEMEIEELEIGSNILNMYVNGTYNFKESSNINILVPWHNLKKRGKNYIPKNYDEGENAKGLKLNFSGPTSNMKLSLGHKEVTKK